MVVILKVNDFVEALAEGVHDFENDTLKIALSNTAPGSESSNPLSSGNGILANITQISYTNYTDDMAVDRTLENVVSGEASGTFTLDGDDIVITASGGDIPDFRYIPVFNDTPTSPADPLLFIIDCEATISIADGDSRTIAWNAAGIATLA